MKERSYLKALRTLREGRNTNPAHKDAFNLLISDLRKKNPQWDRKSVDDHASTTRVLFTEENSHCIKSFPAISFYKGHSL
jgi:hypothetical protein